MRRFVPAALAVAALVIGSGESARADNLLTNPEFNDATPLPWANIDGDASIVWDSEDRSDCAVSGSALGTVSAAAANSARNFFVCVSPVTPDATYSIGGLLNFVTGQATTGEAKIVSVWSAEADCKGTALGGLDSSVVPTAWAGKWIWTAVDATAPPTAASLSLRVRPEKFEAGGTLQLLFDDMFVVEGGGFIFGGGFESGDTCRWSDALGDS